MYICMQAHACINSLEGHVVGRVDAEFEGVGFVDVRGEASLVVFEKCMLAIFRAQPQKDVARLPLRPVEHPPPVTKAS